jgi:TPR repeat protein
MDIYEYEILLYLAENNDFYAIKRILDYYFKIVQSGYIQNEIINIEKEQILKYLNLLIENKDSSAMLSLGALYYTGENEIVEQDYSKAEYWYNEATKNKILDTNNQNSDALNNLGYIYFYGRTKEPDFKKAFFYYSKAASLGNSNAMYKIGDMYKDGKFVDKNMDKAFFWYKKAYAYTRNDDYTTASVTLRLGEAYLYGNGTEISLLNSLKYLQISEKRFYKMVINKPMFSNSMYVHSPIKNVQKLLDVVRKELNKIL